MKNHASRFVALAATFALSLGAASIAHAQAADYPNKPIRMIVPFGAGSVTDQLARTVGSGLAEALGQSVVVENRPGAGGNIGAGFVAASAPDGYTLLMGAASTNAINPSLYKNLKFDPLKDFVPVANVASVTNVLVVNPELKVGTVAELIKALKGGSYSYASGGAGGSQHLSAELFKSMSSTEMVHIPYKGGSEPIPDLISNRVQVMFCNLPVCLPHIKSGKLVALGVTSSKRSPLLPEVPTIAEAGLPGYSVDGWFALFAPAKVPAEIVARLHDETAKLLAKPEVQDQIRRQGAEPNHSTQAEFARFVQAEHDKWAKVIQDANIRIE
ncbi:Bug family tripartite tricarboxylate transporter substrate binding protein [Parapusillimonas granuli]|uniref:Tripartite tricarboxylate transporter substrate binding protein n=1 Tax=Parapusillimonas granuli TaxID=380911 RepID=A0A853G7X5_9BURK|nr:tripartite tricarboxylate transporter substrate binding protein [Parapusillimonas granuli]MBB5215936.1 tripartite-type tricarboxylate transporter receptor subunit TctC [Parapusillimonas granuli]NYT50766.1 tripartite tricarboxylate transporter substrate binding protein [Parapusillimonas granuli]